MHAGRLGGSDMEQVDSRDVWLRIFEIVRPSVSATVRLVAAMLLAYAFVVVLMSSAAQSLVTARLADHTPRIDYSSAYARLETAYTAKAAFAGQEAKARRLERDVATLKRQRELAMNTFESLVEPVQAIVTSGYCGLAASTSIQPNTIDRVMARIDRCVVNAAVPAADTTEARAALETRHSLEMAGRTILTAWATMQATMPDVDLARAEATRLNTLRNSAQDLEIPFAPIMMLRTRPILGGALLVQFPPALLQIVMAFFSGTFGALLLTLVLVVYPNSPLMLSRPGGNYGERILLGGLIAVCVYIVLGGGTAVLGTNNDFADDSANFRAFSAIGVLAGMFSDRVAQWLSKRAEVFYGEDGPAATGKTAHPKVQDSGTPPRRERGAGFGSTGGGGADVARDPRREEPA